MPKWTEQETEILRDMLAAGAKYNEIRKALGRDLRSLYRKANNLKITTRSKGHWSKRDEELLRDLLSTDITYGEIAIKLDRKEECITVRARKLGLRSAMGWKATENKKLKKHGEKRCSTCKEILPLSNFYKRGVNCKPCIKQNRKEDATKSPRFILASGLSSAKTRARKKGLFVDVSIEWLLDLFEKQEGRCYYTGRLMSTSYNLHTSASIDRVDSSTGYTKDNIVLCCAVVNMMKLDHTIDELKDWCKAVVSFKGEEND